jgi:hypothetical protein
MVVGTKTWEYISINIVVYQQKKKNIVFFFVDISTFVVSFGLKD